MDIYWALLWKSYDKPRQHIKKQRHYFASKGHIVKAMVFFSSHVWMWELDHKEGQMPRNWCFWAVVLKTLESPLDSTEIKPVNPKGINLKYSLEGLMLKLKLQYLWPPYWESQLLEKDPDARKDCEQEEKEVTEEWDGWIVSPTDSMDISLTKLQEIGKDRKPGMLQTIRPQRVGHNLVTKLEWYVVHNSLQIFIT